MHTLSGICDKMKKKMAGEAISTSHALYKNLAGLGAAFTHHKAPRGTTTAQCALQGQQT